MFRLKEVWKDLKDSSKYLMLSLVLFTASVYVGITNEKFASFLNAQMDSLGTVVQQINETSNPTLAMLVFIFLNNAVKSVLVIFLGAFFGLYPIFFISINGLLIGYLVGLSMHGMMHVSTFDLIFKLLLPHGIIEIPVLILVAAYGLRLGKMLISTLWALATDHNKLDQIGGQYKYLLKRCGVIAVYAALLLLIAAIIESTLTLWIAETIKQAL